MIVLDSSAIIDILAGTKRGEIIREKIAGEILATTSISVNEVLIGAKEKQRQSIYDFFEHLEILPFDSASAFKSIEIEEALGKKGRMIGKLDILIASVCLSYNLPILTTDNDFESVNGLKVILVEE